MPSCYNEEVILERSNFFKSGPNVFVKKEDPCHRFVVRYSTRTKQYGVYNAKKDEEMFFCPAEFVYGSIMYNPAVDTFPNYVHKQLWMLYEYLRRR